MKDEILQTSLKQFLKYGIREMSIQKLVAPLGISTKTVYKYFENKEQLLEEALKLYYFQQHELMEIPMREQNVVSLLFDIWYMGIESECKMNKLFFQDLNYYYPELEKKVEKTIAKKSWKEIIDIIKKGIQQDVFRKDLDPEILLEAISVAYIAITRKGQFKKFRATIPMVYINTIAVFIRGFCTSKGTQLIDDYISKFKASKKVKASAMSIAVNN